MTTPNLSVQNVSVGSGAMTSSAFEIGHATQLSAVFPVVDSAQLFLAGAVALAGPFARMGNVNSVSAAIPIAAGSCGIMLGSALLASRYGRFEFSASQAAVRSIQVISRV